jgi:hypothetical protein
MYWRHTLESSPHWHQVIIDPFPAFLILIILITSHNLVFFLRTLQSTIGCLMNAAFKEFSPWSVFPWGRLDNRQSLPCLAILLEVVMHHVEAGNRRQFPQQKRGFKEEIQKNQETRGFLCSSRFSFP